MEISLEEYRNISKHDLLLNHKKVLKHTTEDWALKQLSFKLIEDYKERNYKFGFINNIYNILIGYKTLVIINEEFEIKGFLTYHYDKRTKKLTLEYFQSFEKGYGRKIFEYFKKYIKNNYEDCKYIFLEEVANNSNIFWEKMGFMIWPRGLYDFGCYTMKK